MTKELIDIGVYQYSSDNLEQAKKDADNQAARETQYVLIDQQGKYVGPVNKYKKNDTVYRSMAVVYIANPRQR